jgi:hypothetical protein
VYPEIEGAAVLRGHAPGITALEGDDAGPEPTEFVATTVNVYEVPFVKPVTVAEVTVPVAMPVRPPGEEVTVYELMVEPPLEPGAFQLTAAWPLPGVAETPVGARGGPSGVTLLDGDESGLVPTALVAVTVKV